MDRMNVMSECSVNELTMEWLETARRRGEQEKKVWEMEVDDHNPIGVVSPNWESATRIIKGLLDVACSWNNAT